MENDKYKELKTDYSILQLTPRQFAGVNKVADLANEILEIDREVIISIIYRFFILQQRKYERYHFQFDDQMPQIRLSPKFDLMEYVKKELTDALNGSPKAKQVDDAVEKAYKWYVKEYL